MHKIVFKNVPNQIVLTAVYLWSGVVFISFSFSERKIVFTYLNKKHKTGVFLTQKKTLSLTLPQSFNFAFIYPACKT